MCKLEETIYYREAFHELDYPFGKFFLFETFVVAEINKDIVFSWKEHAKPVVEELTHLYGQKGHEIVYISNRVNAYSVVPSDWIHFFRHSYGLKGYAIVDSKPVGRRNSILEKIFMRSSMRSFGTIENAILWAKRLTDMLDVA